MRVTSRVQINTARINQITRAVQASLKQTAEELHTDIVQKQVIPRKDGHLQGEKFYVDNSKSHLGIVRLVFEGPYARRWYYNPEVVPVNGYVIKKGRRIGQEVKAYTARKATFSKDENPNAKGKWFEDWLPGGCYQDFVRYKFEELLRRNGGL